MANTTDRPGGANAASPPPRRPYLRADQRRRQLLDAAERIVGREGLARLTMVGVATEARVSRQLVYEHFNDLPGLVQALVLDRLGEMEAAIGQALGDPALQRGEGPRLAARMILAEPPQDRHIVRVLLAYAGVPGHELNAVAAELRARMLDRWAAHAGAGQDQAARALIWALINATLGLGDLVDNATITVEEAIEQLGNLLTGAAVTLPPRGREPD